MAAAAPTPAILEAFKSRAELESIELVDGQIVQRASPTADHGRTQCALLVALGPMGKRKGDGDDAPGGWWLMTEVDILYPNGDVYRHDAMGYRRANYPACPNDYPVTARPDWVAEVLSRSTAARDLGSKLQTMHAAGVPWYWVLNRGLKLLTVYRHEGPGYIVALTAGAGDVVRAAPFEQIDLSMSDLFEV